MAGGPLYRAGERAAVSIEEAQQLIDQGAAVLIKAVAKAPKDRMIKQTMTKSIGAE
jgi:hypothetical protein